MPLGDSLVIQSRASDTVASDKMKEEKGGVAMNATRTVVRLTSVQLVAAVGRVYHSALDLYSRRYYLNTGRLTPDNEKASQLVTLAQIEMHGIPQ